jgi:hypothetical protein
MIKHFEKIIILQQQNYLTRRRGKAQTGTALLVSNTIYTHGVLINSFLDLSRVLFDLWGRIR